MRLQCHVAWPGSLDLPSGWLSASLEQDAVKKQTGCDWLPHWVYVCSWSEKRHPNKGCSLPPHRRKRRMSHNTSSSSPPPAKCPAHEWLGGGGRCMALAVFYVNPPTPSSPSIGVQPAWWRASPWDCFGFRTWPLVPEFQQMWRQSLP